MACFRSAEGITDGSDSVMKDRVSDVTPMEKKAFEGMVTLVEFAYPDKMNPQTLVGFYRGGSWKGGDKLRKTWTSIAQEAGFYRSGKHDLYHTTTLDLQTNTKQSGVDKAQLQVQMYSGTARKCVACVVLPYKPNPVMSAAKVREAFRQSQKERKVISPASACEETSEEVNEAVRPSKAATSAEGEPDISPFSSKTHYLTVGGFNRLGESEGTAARAATTKDMQTADNGAGLTSAEPRFFYSIELAEGINEGGCDHTNTFGFLKFNGNNDLVHGRPGGAHPTKLHLNPAEYISGVDWAVKDHGPPG